jgi:hypothetical protein
MEHSSWVHHVDRMFKKVACDLNLPHSYLIPQEGAWPMRRIKVLTWGFRLLKHLWFLLKT